MKKIIMLIVLAVIFTSCDQSTKIAYVDMDQVMKEYRAFTKGEEEMKMKSSKIAADFQQLNTQFQQKVQDYQNRRSKMTTAEAKKLEQQLMQEQSMIQQQQQMIQQQYQEEGNKLFDEINKNIDSFINDYAKQKAYDIVLTKSEKNRSLLYADADLDITRALIDGLNSKLPDDNNKSSDTPETKQENK